jgi:hypothetical protein
MAATRGSCVARVSPANARVSTGQAASLQNRCGCCSGRLVARPYQFSGSASVARHHSKRPGISAAMPHRENVGVSLPRTGIDSASEEAQTKGGSGPSGQVDADRSVVSA